MKCYLAGPMTGYPHCNFVLFAKAARHLRDAGHVVLSPAENDIHSGVFPDMPTARDPETISSLFRWDVRSILESEGVVFLPNWRKSKGSQLERAVAHFCNVPCYDYIPTSDGGFTLERQCELVPVIDFKDAVPPCI